MKFNDSMSLFALLNRHFALISGKVIVFNLKLMYSLFYSHPS